MLHSLMLIGQLQGNHVTGKHSIWILKAQVQILVTPLALGQIAQPFQFEFLLI